jgi:hypothetical protein
MNSRKVGRCIRTLLPTRAALSSPLATRRQSDVCDKPLNLSASGYETHSGSTCAFSNSAPLVLGVYELARKVYTR